MKRTKLFFTAIVMGTVLFSGISAFAQTDVSTAKEQRKIDRQMRKADREAARQQEEVFNAMLFRQAKQALEERDFVLEADRAEFRRGYFLNVNSMTNFVAVKGNKAVVQLSLSRSFSGPNGVGGITVEGTISNEKIQTDKRGNITYSMMVQGIGISAYVTFMMTEGTDRCTATVSPNFNGNRVTFTGHLVPTDRSRVYKGRTI